MDLQVVPFAVLAATAAWFWPHCARPMLRYRHAGPLTTRVLFGVTLYTVFADAMLVALALTGSVTQLIVAVAGGPWILLVALPYLDDYRTLLRLAGER